MRSIPASFFFLATASLVACGGGSSNPDAPVVVVPDAAIDAPPPPPDEALPMFDFTCENDTPATTAPAMLTLSGTATDFEASQMPVPVADADIKAFNATNQQIGMQNVKTDASGAWSLMVPTGSVPLDGYIEASKAGHRSVRLYPSNPLATDLANAPVLLLMESTFGLVQFLLMDTQDPAKGAAGIQIVDCANTPIAGATLTVKQGGQDVGKQHDASMLQPGAFLVLDVPPGDTIVGATFNGHTLHAHTVVSVAGQTVTTVVTPRP